MTDAGNSQLRQVYDALCQAQDCIRGETPEDVTDAEAREDTISKVREAMRTVEGMRGAAQPSRDTVLDEGIDFALEQLCQFLGVDPTDVSWDAATETTDGDVRSVIGNILRGKFGEDWGPNETHPSQYGGMGEAVAWVVDGPLPLDSSEVFLVHAKALEAFNDWGKRITPLYAAPQPPANAPQTLPGMIAAIYGSLDAEDCKWIDGEWAKQRGYVLPTDGTSTLAYEAKEPTPITMSDIRLAAGEGKLSARAVLDAANAVLRMRHRSQVSSTERKSGK